MVSIARLAPVPGDRERVVEMAPLRRLLMGVLMPDHHAIRRESLGPDHRDLLQRHRAVCGVGRQREAQSLFAARAAARRHFSSCAVISREACRLLAEDSCGDASAPDSCFRVVDEPRGHLLDGELASPCGAELSRGTPRFPQRCERRDRSEISASSETLSPCSSGPTTPYGLKSTTRLTPSSRIDESARHGDVHLVSRVGRGRPGSP